MEDRKLVVALIGAFALVALVGVIILAGTVLALELELTAEVALLLGGLTTAGTGAIALLAPSPLSKSSTAADPQLVEVVNTSRQPIPVEPAA